MGQGNSNSKSTLDQIEDRMKKKYNKNPEPINYKPILSNTSNPGLIEWDQRDEYLREHKNAEFVIVPKDHTNPLAWNISTKRMYMIHTTAVFLLVLLGITLFYNRLDESDKLTRALNFTAMIASSVICFLGIYFSINWKGLWLDRILFKPDLSEIIYDVEDRHPGDLARAGQHIIDDSNRDYRKLLNTGEQLKDKIDG